MRELACAGHDGVEVTLAGRRWVMAALAPRQLRKVIPAIMGFAALARPDELDERCFDHLLDALYYALTRNYPDLGHEEFLDLPITTSELIASLPALASVSGIERREDGRAGEASGAAADSTVSSIH
jgi:hypothetical protein